MISNLMVEPNSGIRQLSAGCLLKQATTAMAAEQEVEVEIEGE